MKFMPDTKEISFRYPIGTEVFFMHKDQAYSGKIIGREYSERQVEREWSDPMIKLDTIYTVVNYKANQDFTFSEGDFGLKVFADKQEFIDKKVIIN